MAARKPAGSATTPLARASGIVLRLYVAGATPRSTRAILAARTFCEEHLQDGGRLEVIDIYQQPQLAIAEQIIAVPTLIRHEPGPTRRLVGDLSNFDRVLSWFEMSYR
jgi:circadian clock protein KaiB